MKPALGLSAHGQQTCHPAGITMPELRNRIYTVHRRKNNDDKTEKPIAAKNRIAVFI